MKVEVSELVETGSVEYIGSSFYISVLIKDNERIEDIKILLDYLDHCLIIEDSKSLEDYKQFAERYFYIKKGNNIFDEIYSIVDFLLESNSIKYNKIKIKKDKIIYSYKNNKKRDKKLEILDFSIKD